VDSLSPGERAGILGENCARIYGIDDRSENR
jgi:hypothetical protein